MRLVTNSEIALFRACPQRWWFQYGELLSPPPRAATPASWGTLGHEGMRAAWGEAARLKAARQPVSVERCAEVGRLGILSKEVELVSEALENGQVDQIEQIHEQADEVKRGIDVTVLGMRDALERHVLIGTEIPFAVPFPVDGVQYGGQIDLVTWDPDAQRIVVWDHKFTSSVDAYEGRLQLDTQSSGYIYAVRELQRAGVFHEVPGGTVGAFVWSLSRRKVPSVPHVNKLTKKDATVLGLMGAFAEQEASGTPLGYVSSAACDTLPAIYEQALEEQESVRLIPRTDAQVERLREIERGIGKWYKQEEHHIGDQQIDRWLAEAVVSVKQMLAAEKDPSLRIRHPGHCSTPQSYRCDYDMICLVDEPEVRALYQVRTKQHAEIQG